MCKGLAGVPNQIWGVGGWWGAEMGKNEETGGTQLKTALHH